MGTSLNYSDLFVMYIWNFDLVCSNVAVVIVVFRGIPLINLNYLIPRSYYLLLIVLIFDVLIIWSQVSLPVRLGCGGSSPNTKTSLSAGCWHCPQHQDESHSHSHPKQWQMSLHSWFVFKLQNQNYKNRIIIKSLLQSTRHILIVSSFENNVANKSKQSRPAKLHTSVVIDLA